MGEVSLTAADSIAIIEIRNVENANALTTDMFGALEAGWQWFEGSSELRVAVLTGAGDRHFCAGADTRHLADQAQSDDPRDQQRFQWWPSATVSKPVVAAVNGAAVGAGLGLAVDCDVLVASANATFSSPHVSMGIPCGFGVYRLAARIPPAEAARVALMGKHGKLSADRAHTLGLVSALTPSPEEAKQLAIEVASTIAAQAPDAVAATLKLLRRVSWDDHEVRLIEEAQEQVFNWNGAEAVRRTQEADRLRHRSDAFYSAPASPND
jgi:E-phenylitaconyl-CoA hydratase